MITIIIPTYNRSHLIDKTLDSIISQSYLNWECLVIDDGSTDDTVQVLKNYIKKDNRIKYFKKPENISKGANSCRNYGLDLSQGNFINWFDDDDIMHRDKLKLQIEKLKKSNSDFCVCQSMIFKDSIKNTIGIKSKKLKTNDSFFDFLQMKIVWLTQAPLFKKSFLIDNNFRFNETLKAAQEWELFSRILFKSTDYQTINEPLVYLRQHKNSISAKDKEITRGWYYVLARFSLYKSLKNQLSKANISYLRGYCIHYFKLFLRNGNYSKSWFILKNMFLFKTDVKIKKQFQMTLAFVSYFITSKGAFLLPRI